MAFNFKKFWEGLRIVPKTTSTADEMGDLEVIDSTGKLGYHNGSTVSNVVTENHDATLANKDLVDSTTRIVDFDDDTIAIEFDAEGTTATKTTIVSSQTEDRILTLPDTTDTIAVQSDVDERISGPASSVDNQIPRFDGTTGKIAQGSAIRITDAGIIEPHTTDADLSIQGNNLGKVNIGGGVGVATSGRESNSFTIPSGASVVGNLVLDPSKNIRLNSSTISPVDMIEAQLAGVTSMINGMEINLINVSGADIIFNHLSGATASRQINTGTGAAVTLRNGDSISLVYNGNEEKWQLIGSVLKNSSTSSVDNTLVRFDGTTGQFIQESSVVLNDSEEMSGLTKLNVDNVEVNGNEVTVTTGDLNLNSVSGDVTIEKDFHVKQLIRFEAVNDTSTGSNATLPLPTVKHIRLTDPGLVSIDMIQSPGGYQELTLQNLISTPIIINNNTGATAAWRILTGTGGAVKLGPGASINLAYDATASNWRLVGAAGGSTTTTKFAGEDLVVGDYVYISNGTGNDSGRNAGQAYKVDVTNDDRIEAIGFVSAAGLSGTEVEITVDGIIDTYVGLSYGKMYFADPSTPGAITVTPPSTNNIWAISVGVAISDTELLINQTASASAQYIQDSETEFTIANNVAVATNVTDLLFDGALNRAFMLDYSIYRQTDTASSAVAQVGQLRGVYNTQSTTWYLSDDFAGQNAGVTFSITSGGQIQYTSTDIAGANYVGTMKYNPRKTFEV